MKTIKVLLAVTALLSASAQANLVTLQGYSPSTLHGGGTLTFTYDDTTPDSIHDEFLDGPLPAYDPLEPSYPEQEGWYQNAITQATFVSTSGITNGKVFTLVDDGSSYIHILRRRYHSKISVNITLSDGETQDVFTTYNTFNTCATDGLHTLLEPIDFVDDSLWFFMGDVQNFYGQGPGPFTLISNTPIPATAWLFGSGLLGLIGVARRHKAT